MVEVELIDHSIAGIPSTIATVEMEQVPDRDEGLIIGNKFFRVRQRNWFIKSFGEVSASLFLVREGDWQ